MQVRFEHQTRESRQSDETEQEDGDLQRDVNAEDAEEKVLIEQKSPMLKIEVKSPSRLEHGRSPNVPTSLPPVSYELCADRRSDAVL